VVVAKKILIIEDDQDIVSLLEYRLAAHGFDVITALDGAAGLALARSERPDLITLDINLPEVNGFTVCSMLKADKAYHSIPIIFLTARDGYADNVFDDSVKPEAYVTKPFDINELVDKIRQLIPGHDI